MTGKKVLPVRVEEETIEHLEDEAENYPAVRSRSTLARNILESYVEQRKGERK